MNDDDLYRLIWLSRPLMQRAEALVEKHLAGTGLTVRMRAVMEILTRDGPSTVPDLAFKLEIQRQYVQQMVNEAMTAGYLEKHPNPRHRRSSLIALTAAGKDMIKTVMAKETTVVARMSQGFDKDQLSTTLAVTAKLIEALQTELQGEDI